MEKYFGQFSKIFDALITHKVVVIVIVFFFSLFVNRCCSLSSEVRLSLFACVLHYYLIYPCFLVLL